MKRYACFRYGDVESWWEMIHPPTQKARQVYHSEDLMREGSESHIRVFDKDCEHFDELPDHVLAVIAKRRLLGEVC